MPKERGGLMITFQDIQQQVADTVRRIGVRLPDDVAEAIKGSLDREHPDTPGYSVIDHILKNLSAAEELALPMCQDTGMCVVFVDIGSCAPVELGIIDHAVEAGIEQAYREGFFRKSVVDEPVFERENTGNNLPAVIHHHIVPGDELTISILLKGFGSENCSGLAMLNPTAGIEGIEQAVVSLVTKSGGKPCPPIVIGIGVGGTADRAMELSKRALFRDLDDTHHDSRYAELESRLLDAVNALHVGPGGVGGEVTALAVKINADPTHIAGMPVGINISCWADRKAVITLKDSKEKC